MHADARWCWILGLSLLLTVPGFGTQDDPGAQDPGVQDGLAAQDGSGEWSQETLDRMARPIAPFRLVGNLYYVGTHDVASYLVTTPGGHVLLDGGFPQTAEHVLASIEALGFEPADVKILLSSHAHIDHAGGLARLRQATGARLVASAGDAPLLESGYASVPGAPSYLLFPPVEVDRVVADGDEVSLGGSTLVARVTAGHTPGCTSWTMGVTPLDGEVTVAEGPLAAVFVCSLNVLDGMELVDNPDYPTIAEDFAASFRGLEERPCELFFGSHATFFSMERKLTERQSLGEGAPGMADPFVDPEGCRRHIAAKKARFEKALAEQRAAARGEPGA